MSRLALLSTPTFLMRLITLNLLRFSVSLPPPEKNNNRTTKRQ